MKTFINVCRFIIIEKVLRWLEKELDKATRIHREIEKKKEEALLRNMSNGFPPNGY